MQRLAGWARQCQRRSKLHADRVLQVLPDAVAYRGRAQVAVKGRIQGDRGACGDGCVGLQAGAFGGDVQAFRAQLLDQSAGVLPGDPHFEIEGQAGVPAQVCFGRQDNSWANSGANLKKMR